jgi:hypothetical protein
VLTSVAIVDDLPPIDSNPTWQQTISSPVFQRNPSAASSNPAANSSRSSLDILTTVISNFLTPTVTATTDKRKHRLDRPYAESLTTVEALKKIQEKETRAQKRKKPVPTMKGVTKAKKPTSTR